MDTEDREFLRLVRAELKAHRRHLTNILQLVAELDNRLAAYDNAYPIEGERNGYNHQAASEGAAHTSTR